MSTNQLDKINEKLDQLKARKREILSRETAKKRKEDTRRKIMIGGAVLALQKRQPNFSNNDIMQYLNDTITKTKDRELLGLPPLSSEPE